MQKNKVIGARLIELVFPAHIMYFHYHKSAVNAFVHNNSTLRIVILTRHDRI